MTPEQCAAQVGQTLFASDVAGAGKCSQGKAKRVVDLRQR